ncbi:MAG: enoyl-CoA hydratase [Sulfobacillus acidophilus]|uniref:Enoyl-CoA hydratase n=1 Tax=Sulfobacillus acidophilus TaxID=53633 RepID=A0A2T2WL09_9FIRM|nr:MAG: enoyl-CoA hydratase [Sulfobacillus acidophilus]
MLTTLDVQHDGAIVVVRLNRNEALNAISEEMVKDFGDMIDQVSHMSETRVLVLTGSLQAFSAGADLKEISRIGNTWNVMEHFLDEFNEVLHRLERLPKIVVAAIAGVAYGGGLELALAADFRILSPGTRLALPEVRIGVMPGAGGTQRLPRLIGYQRAKYMALAGTPIDATTALGWGLADVVCHSSEDLMDATRAFCAPFLQNAPLSLGAIKEAVLAGRDADLITGLSIERHHLKDLYQSFDAREGIQAFNERRRPLFRGE